VERFSRVSFSQIGSRLEELGINSSIEAVGIIWSNPVQSRPLDRTRDRVNGVSGVVTGIAEGKGYRKGEFFVAELYDGYPLGEMFLTDALELGLPLKVFTIGNDTIFVLKAAQDARAGMVASTGANATDVDSAGFIYNTEMGCLYVLDESLLSEGDKTLYAGRGDGAFITLETLMAGKWLPRILEGHIACAADAGISELRSVSDYVKVHWKGDESFLTGKDVAALLGGEDPGVAGLKELVSAGVLSNENRAILTELGAAVVQRAGEAAAGMAYFSLANQLEHHDKLILSLDSTQATYLPGYFPAMQEKLAVLVGPNKKLELALQQPEGEVTVPMKGLANALAGQLALAEE